MAISQKERRAARLRGETIAPKCSALLRSDTRFSVSVNLLERLFFRCALQSCTHVLRVPPWRRCASPGLSQNWSRERWPKCHSYYIHCFALCLVKQQGCAELIHLPVASCTPRVRASYCRTQFVNHVYNSQQLSNKALLAGHLAYRHDHYRRQRQLQASRQYSEAREDPSNSCGHDHHSKAVGDPGVAAAETTAASRPGLEAAVDTEITNPEAFFPRCWDVSDDGDGVCSILKAFAVSAAVALLRTAVKTEVWLVCDVWLVCA